MRLKLSVSSHGDAVVLVVDGPLTLEGGDSFEFRKLVEQELREGNKKIVVDLSKCSYADSSGIAVLVSAFTKSANSGAKVVIANPQPKLQELLKITRLETILKPYDSVESALAAVQSSTP